MPRRLVKSQGDVQQNKEMLQSYARGLFAELESATVALPPLHTHLHTAVPSPSVDSADLSLFTTGLSVDVIELLTVAQPMSPKVCLAEPKAALLLCTILFDPQLT